MQKFTQKGGARPFGLSIMIAGVDPNGNPQLNQIDPSGMITYYKANCIGRSYKFVNEYLEKEYKEDLSLEDGLKMVATCLMNNIDHPKKNSEFVVVSNKDVKFLSQDKIDELYDSLDEE